MAQYPQIPNTTYARRVLLQQWLQQYKNVCFACPSLGKDVKVWVNGNSISEIVHHAGTSVLSTKLALRLPYIIGNAKVLIPYQVPKENKQTKKFNFNRMIVLTCGVKGLGTALLTIGATTRGNYVQYCVTDIKKHKK